MKIPAARIVIPEEDRKWVLKQIDEVMTSGQLTLGKFTRQLEEAFAQKHQARYAVAVNSGTSSLEILLRILDVRGKEVIVPTNTFFATAAAVVHAGGVPRFADINAETFALSLNGLQQALSDRTAGVIIVHIGGIITPEIREISDFCRQKSLFLIEDAAHAHGSSLSGKMAGTFGIGGSFSFYPTKVMTTGEGGMIVTDDEGIYKEALIYRDQGKAGFYGNYHVRMGYNWRISELHAVLGLAQLKRLDEFIEARTQVARIYSQGLKDIPRVHAILPPPSGISSYYKYMVMLDGEIDRGQLKLLLKERFGVSLSGEVYEVPLHLQPSLKDYADRPLPIAEDVCRRHICLPIYSDMAAEEAQYVLDCLAKALAELQYEKGGDLK